jgi:hypothetical protein
MRPNLILASLAIALFCSTDLIAQSDTKKMEVGPLFTSITKPDFFGGRTEPGFGGRFTFNLTENFAAEAEGNFFPGDCVTCTSENVGRLTQGFFGVKVGKRFKRFGIFAKGRPGFASFSKGAFDLVLLPTPPGMYPQFLVNRSRQTNFAFDLGGVIELYHSKRIFTRFDGGDTMIRYGRRINTFFSFDPETGITTPFQVPTPAHTRHNFQFSASVGFRF